LSHDIVVTSPHGAALLDHVLADMKAAGQTVLRRHDDPPVTDGEATTSAGVPLVTTA
jgi:hypothetical protein